MDCFTHFMKEKPLFFLYYMPDTKLVIKMSTLRWQNVRLPCGKLKSKLFRLRASAL